MKVQDKTAFDEQNIFAREWPTLLLPSTLSGIPI